jgi:hypothetical protein
MKNNSNFSTKMLTPSQVILSPGFLIMAKNYFRQARFTWKIKKKN